MKFGLTSERIQQAMAAPIKKVAILGAAGNFGTPITAALVKANFEVTIITRAESTSTFPASLSVIRIDYTLPALAQAFKGQDAAVCVVGPAGISLQATMVDAAEAAGVKRFILDDFGWGPVFNGLEEFDAIKGQRTEGWDRAREMAEANLGFTWTGISTGNPIDWAIKKFPLMGFNIAEKTATIYDDGTEYWTGTTLEGIGQSVVGVLQHPEETANRFVKVVSIKTNQNELLQAFQEETGSEWPVERSTSQALLDRGREANKAGKGGWILDLVVAQLLDKGKARCVLAESWEKSDSGLLGVVQKTPREIAAVVMAS